MDAMHDSRPQPEELTAVAQFATHADADDAIRQLVAAGVSTGAISVIGRNHPGEEHGLVQPGTGESARFYGRFGALWGGLAGFLLGSGFFFIPFIGSLTALGPAASAIVGAIEGAALGGGASALYGALAAMGLPHDSAIRHEDALKADRCLVLVHCDAAQVTKVRQLLAQAGGSNVESHPVAKPAA